MTVARADRKAWAREHFRGIENVLMPSFGPDLRALDEAGVRLDVRQSVRHGFFSTLCALETGLTTAEQRRFLGVAVDEAKGDIGVALSLTADSLEENLALLRDAETLGATHALVSYPQGFAPRSQDDVYDYVRALSEATNLGLYLFVSDKFSFHHLHPSGVPFEAFDRLADLDNVVALKLGGMDTGMILECLERFSSRLLVTSVNLGMIPLLRKDFDIRWTGAWTAEALQSPERPWAVDMFKAMLNDKPQEAMRLYWRMAPALGSMMRILGAAAPTGTYHWPLLKYQQWLSGGNGGMTRQPVMRVFERDMQAIRGGLRAVEVACADPDDDFFIGRAEMARRARIAGTVDKAGEAA